MRGIDVASHQGYPNWGAVKNSDVHYAYIKASEGVNYVSTHVDRQWVEATGAGIVRGLYHFARPDLNGPEPEAELFARVVNAKGAKGPGFLPPCLDIEVGGGHLGWWVQRFITRLRQMIDDHRVMVYAGGSFYRNQVGDGALPPNTLAWIAHYNGTPGRSSYLTPRTVMHQYSDSGRVNGIAGNVDLNWATRPLNEITGGGVVPPPPAQGDADLTPEQDAMLRQVLHELLGPRGPQGQIQGWGTENGPRTVVAMLVDIVNTLDDVRGARAEAASANARAANLQARVAEVIQKIESGQHADGAAVKAALVEVLKENLVRVDVTVNAQQAGNAAGNPQ